MNLEKILRLGISKGLSFELLSFISFSVLVGKNKKAAMAFSGLLLIELLI